MAYLLLTLTTLFWAGNFVLARAFSVDIPPITLALIRWSLAFVILLPFAIPTIYKYRDVIRQYWPRLVLFGALSVAGFNTLAYIGLQTTTAMNGTLMQSSMPIMILCMSTLVLRESATMRQWLGVLLSLLGVLALISKGDPEALMSLNFNSGDLWVLLAMFVWACYSLALRWKPKEMSGFAFFSVSLTVGVIILVPLSLLETERALQIHWDTDLMLLISYLAIFPSILAYLFWNYGVEKLGAHKAGLFIHQVPMWGIVLSVIFLAEQVQAFHLWGIALIFTGIYLAVVAGTVAGKS
ncbi:DMT family transporter [Neptuniibacter sp. QD72_48]|uniref:DMT family transporter n=1 Tax=unclassified Neptuniibacter TaxID=2630693 RepID=UPI0039F5BE21